MKKEKRFLPRRRRRRGRRGRKRRKPRISRIARIIGGKGENDFCLQGDTGFQPVRTALENSWRGRLRPAHVPVANARPRSRATRRLPLQEGLTHHATSMDSIRLDKASHFRRLPNLRVPDCFAHSAIFRRRIHPVEPADPTPPSATPAFHQAVAKQQPSGISKKRSNHVHSPPRDGKANKTDAGDRAVKRIARLSSWMCPPNRTSAKHGYPAGQAAVFGRVYTRSQKPNSCDSQTPQEHAGQVVFDSGSFYQLLEGQAPSCPGSRRKRTPTLKGNTEVAPPGRVLDHSPILDCLDEL